MKHTLAALSLVISIIMLAGCATATGTAVGAGIGSITGDTKTGAIVGGSIGALHDLDVF